MEARSTLAVALAILAAAIAAPSAGAAADPCAPVTAACTAGATARATASARRLATTTSAGPLLRALGIPSVSAIARRPSAARRTLDAALVAALGRAPPAPAGAAPRAAGAPTTTVALTPARDAVGGVLRVDQLLRRGARIERDLVIEVEAAACPRMTAAGNSRGAVRIEVSGRYTLLGSFIRGRRASLRTVNVILSPIAGTAFVGQDARLDGILFADAARVLVNASGSVGTGRSRRAWRSNTRLTARPAETGWAAELDDGDFDAFVARQAAADRGEPAPGRERPLADQRAYAQLVQAFLAMVDARVERALADAERGWLAPNRCARLDLAPTTGTARLGAGRSRTVSGRVVPRAGGIDGRNDRWPAPATTVGIATYDVEGSAHGAPAVLAVTGAAAVGGRSARLRLRVPSTVGVAEGEWTALPVPYPQTISGTFSGGVPSQDGLAWSGAVTFTYLPLDPVTGFPYPDGPHYRVTAGALDWSVSGCTPLGPTTLPATAFDGDGSYSLQIDAEDTPPDGVGYSFSFGMDATPPGSYGMPYRCAPDGPIVDGAIAAGALEGALVANGDTRARARSASRQTSSRSRAPARCRRSTAPRARRGRGASPGAGSPAPRCSVQAVARDVPGTS